MNERDGMKGGHFHSFMQSNDLLRLGSSAHRKYLDDPDVACGGLCFLCTAPYHILTTF